MNSVTKNALLEELEAIKQAGALSAIGGAAKTIGKGALGVGKLGLLTGAAMGANFATGVASGGSQ